MSFRWQLMRSTRSILEFMEISEISHHKFRTTYAIHKSPQNCWLLWWNFAFMEFHSIFTFHPGAVSVLCNEIQVHTDWGATSERPYDFYPCSVVAWLTHIFCFKRGDNFFHSATTEAMGGHTLCMGSCALGTSARKQVDPFLIDFGWNCRWL